MHDKTESRVAKVQSRDKNFTLGRYMKGMFSFYWVVVVVFMGIAAVAVGRQAASGNLQPVAWSNFPLVGLTVFLLSLTALLVGCGCAFLLLAKTTISSSGITRPSWLGGLAVSWSDVILVSPDPIGLQFKTKKGKTLIIPFRIFDSVPAKLLGLIGEQISRPAFVGLDPDAPASWLSKENR